MKNGITYIGIEPQGRHKALFILAVMLLVYSGFFLLAYSFPHEPIWNIHAIVTMISMMVGALLVYHSFFKNPLGIFTPLYMVLIPYSVYFIIFPIIVFFINEKVIVAGQEDYLTRTMWYLTAGLAAFLSGFFLILIKNTKLFAQSLQKIKPGISFGKSIELHPMEAAFIAFVALALAVAAWLYLVFNAGGVGFILENLNLAYLETFSKNMYLVTLINALFFVNISVHMGIVLKRGKGKLLFIANCLLVLAMMLVQGSRGSIISVFFFSPIMWHMYVKKISFPKVLIMSLGFIVFMVALFFFRDVDEAGSTIFADVLYDAIIIANDEMTLLLNFVINMPNIMDYKYGLSFLHLLLLPIPRYFWMDKPEGFHVETTKLFIPQYTLSDINWPPSIIGELYANFHVAGIILGMFLFGIACAWLQTFILRSVSYFRLSCYGIALFAVFREVRGDFSTVTAIFLMQLLVFATLGRCAFKSPRASANRRSRNGEAA